MLENPSTPAGSAGTEAVVKRYAPPNQRNRPLNRRKSSERDRTSQRYGNDFEKTASRNVSLADHGDGGGRSNTVIVHENTRPTLVAIQGCCSSEASRLLIERWAAAMHLFNDPSIDLSGEQNNLHSSERPVLYAGSGASAWDHIRLPHQIMAAAANAETSGSQMDFLSELQRAMQTTTASFDA